MRYVTFDTHAMTYYYYYNIILYYRVTYLAPRERNVSGSSNEHTFRHRRYMTNETQRGPDPSSRARERASDFST